MKAYYFKLWMIAFLVLTSCNSKQECNENQSFDIGELHDNWIYENKQLGFSFAIPTNWYYLDNRSPYKKSIPITEKLDKELFDHKSITLKEIKEISLERGEPLYPIITICDFAVDGSKDLNNNIWGNKLSFSIGYSYKQNQDKDINSLIDIFKERFNGNNIPDDLKKLNDNRFLSTYDMPFGKNEKIPCFTLADKTSNGEIRYRQFGIKNFGCVNILITIDYLNERELKKVFAILKEIKN